MEELRKQAAELLNTLRNFGFEAFLKNQGPMMTMSVLMNIKCFVSGEDAKYVDSLIKKIELL